MFERDPDLNKNRLIYVAGGLWGIIGLFLVYRSALLYQLALEEQHSTRQAIILSLLIGMLIGLIKGRFVLAKTAHRNKSRILDLEPPVKIHHTFSKPFYGFILLMILLGVLLRTLNGYLGGYIVVGAIYAGIGMALIVSSRVYWREEPETAGKKTS